MQIFALDNEKVITLQEARRKKIYLCPHCREKIVIRGGIFRKKHFYHLNSFVCRKREKSELHRSIQEYLKKTIPSLELEYPFLSINRIADAAWHEKKIVFEIQCSLISEDIIDQREQDYREIGYQVVWLMSDKVFNKRILTSSELRIRKSIGYFINFFIYDQEEYLNKNIRISRGKKLRVDIKQPLFDKKLHFKGDLFYLKRNPQKSRSFKDYYLCLLEYLLSSYNK